MLDMYGRQFSQLITYEEALKRFMTYLKFAEEGATPVYEVRSFAINNLAGIKTALGQVPLGSVVWQHTSKWHTAGIYIKKNNGRKFSRQVINLFSHGVTNEKAFKELWIATNGAYERGVFPKCKGDYPATVRKSQLSYIVAAQNIPENLKSKIPGTFHKNQVHRTHLLSAQTTGIESHKGLLVDFDGWLNVNPMNQFETKILNLTTQQDIVWTANLWIDENDHLLHWLYQMYTGNYDLIAKKEWIDDRWTYIWRYDKDQDKLANKNGYM